MWLFSRPSGIQEGYRKRNIEISLKNDGKVVRRKLHEH
jgi:hypothetical protein